MSRTQYATALDEYRARTATSLTLFESAQSVIPGGVSRATLAFEPYPFYAATAQGAHITDVDGNEYLDLVNNYTSLPHGHAHRGTLDAAIRHLEVSSAIGVAHALEAEYAIQLRDRLPAMERMHFTTTGSEAVGFAARVARANTGRERILKFEGGFHGSHNELYQDIAVMPALQPSTSALARPASSGLEQTGTITAVYNDPASVRDAFERWGKDIAAVIVEPFMGNSALVSANREFLDQIFASAQAAGALVIFDEVQSLRAGYSGAQGVWGCSPDLVAVGKIMGGGFPLAAFGGRADLFHVLNGTPGGVLQTGTFTATPVALAAGQAAMAELDKNAYKLLETRTEGLRQGIRNEFERAGIGVHVNGMGSMFNICLSDVPVDSYRTYRAADNERFAAIRMELLVRGVMIMPRGTGCLSTAVTDNDVSQVIAALRDSLDAHTRN